jgi:hypothetical protein
MKRRYKGYIEVKGQIRAMSSPMYLARVLTWLKDQKRFHGHLMRADRDWKIYYQTESMPDPNKADFKINRAYLSEQEKTVNKYL